MLTRPNLTAFTLSICLTAAQGLAGQMTSTGAEHPANLTSAGALPRQVSAPAIFTVTQNQLRKAYDQYESKGEHNKGISVGESKTVNIPAQGSHGVESLKLTILFMPPPEQAKIAGYRFGLVAKQRTPEDRKDSEPSSLSLITKGADEIAFRVWMTQPKDANASLPDISYSLLDKDGRAISTTTQPASYLYPDKDLIGAVAISEDGLPLTFPLYAGGVPNLTDKMDKMTLVVSVGGRENKIEFRIK